MEVRGAKSAYVWLGCGVFAISWSALFARWSGVAGPVSAFWRVALAGLLLLIWSIVTRSRLLSWRQFSLASCGGVFFAADLALFNTAATHASATNVTVLGNNTPLFASLLSWIIWGRRPSAKLCLGLACGALGTVILAGGDLLRSNTFAAADLMALTASLCFAVYLLATERVRAETGTLSFLTAALGATAISLLLFNVAVGYPLAIPTPQAKAAVIGLALIPQLIGYLAITHALGHLPATTVSIGLTAQVPATAILAAVLMGERLLAHELLGGVLVLIAIWITLQAKPQSPLK